MAGLGNFYLTGCPALKLKMPVLFSGNLTLRQARAGTTIVKNLNELTDTSQNPLYPVNYEKLQEISPSPFNGILRLKKPVFFWDHDDALGPNVTHHEEQAAETKIHDRFDIR
ncbi:hypothetical protein [Gillisia sp. Hel_I_86]|uniref:hypothetical protein n=1 Tax=Gillisia sp. Hel_I_86 TaxID=1249981 RepID=UPI0011AA4043|nr:hypothetical protein [Gillisia sp. Hel_I_86]